MRNAEAKPFGIRGSLLPYSFSEIGQPKSVTLVELGAEGVETTEFIELKSPTTASEAHRYLR